MPIQELLSGNRPQSISIIKYTTQINKYHFPYNQSIKRHYYELQCRTSTSTHHPTQNNPQFKIVDVRTPEEYQENHIPGSILIPQVELNLKIKELAKEDTHLMVCRSGNRSGVVTNTLTQQGYKAINLAGGIVSWTAQKLPTAKL